LKTAKKSPFTLRATAMAVGSWHLTGVGPTLAMALAWRCTYNQFPFVLSYQSYRFTDRSAGHLSAMWLCSYLPPAHRSTLWFPKSLKIFGDMYKRI
jgi:hypothetical protein